MKRFTIIIAVLLAAAQASAQQPVNATLQAGTAYVGEITEAATAVTTNAALGCYIGSGVGSAASTNSTSCKGSAGNLYGLRVINTTSTIYYLRLYNSSSAPTCSSATGFIETIPIPNASGAGAGIVAFSGPPIGYSTGIGFCITAGSGNTDNTSAATGVFGTLYYK